MSAPPIDETHLSFPAPENSSMLCTYQCLEVGAQTPEEDARHP